MPDKVTPDQIYSFISTITNSISYNYDAKNIAEACSKVISREVALGMDRSRDSIGLIGDLVYHEFLCDETSLLHPLLKHHCQILDMFTQLIGPEKVLMNDAFFVMDLFLDKYSSRNIHLINNLQLFYMEEFLSRQVENVNVITFPSIENDDYDYDYDLIILNIYRVSDFRMFEKFYNHLNPGGAIILSGSHQQGTLYNMGRSHPYSYLHENFKSFPDSNVFHISDGIGYTVIKKGL
jgi:hypothetical protein